MKHSISYLVSQFSYDKESGLIKWNVTRNRVKKGQVAGNKHLGYIRIKLNGRTYAAHRLAWLFSYGRWPKNEIDHINGIRHDNRLCNLREATHAENLQNCMRRNRNKYGLRGVSKQTCSKRWAATITVNGTKLHLGTFATPEEAHAEYLKAVRIHHGKFANLTTANHKENPMSRKPSVVLSATEKKAALKEAKLALKSAQAAVKELEKQAKAVAKARAAEDKEAAKLATSAAKTVEKAQAEVDALSAE